LIGKKVQKWDWERVPRADADADKRMKRCTLPLGLGPSRLCVVPSWHYAVPLSLSGHFGLGSWAIPRRAPQRRSLWWSLWAQG